MRRTAATDDPFAGWLGPEATAPAPPARPVELAPAQRWYLESAGGDADQWTIALLVRAAEELDPDRLHRALRMVAGSHPALRLRVVRDGRGRWGAAVCGEREPRFGVVDLRDVPTGDRAAVIESVTARECRGCDLDRGPLVRAVLFDVPGAGEVLLVVHHLAFDEHSQWILLQDLEAAYLDPLGYEAGRAADDGEYVGWVERQVARATSAAGRAAAEYWLAMPELPPLPEDLPGGIATEGTAAYTWTGLDGAATAALLEGLGHDPRLNLETVLLGAAYQAVTAWTGERRTGLWLLNHGRTTVVATPPTARLVGCLLHAYPVALEAPSGCEDVLDLCVALRAQVEAVPHLGVDFEILSYLGDPTTRERMASVPLPGVTFNFVGSFDRRLAGRLFVEADPDRSLQHRDPRRPFPLALELDSVLEDGAYRCRFKYGPERHRADTVEALKERFRASLLDIAGRLAGRRT